MTLGDRLKKKRLDLNLHIKEVALMLGVDLHTISRWENNEAWPLPQSVTKICEFLGDVPSEEISKLSLGERIFKYRKARNLTLRQLAKQLDVTATTVSCWERNKNKPRKNQRKSSGK
ncbi:helix-turn-helix domain-containing protein [bacterium]|nr:helix-turn-helix domain-containing protein [bacterium]